jgi:hypothetical protein
VRDRIGEVHQSSAFVTYVEKKSGKEGTGIQVTLSLSELDTAAIGY